MKTQKTGMRFRGNDAMGLIIAIVALFIIMSVMAEGFLSWYNLHNVLKDFSILLIIKMSAGIEPKGISW